MQQGSARPCAVKYISDQGRRQVAQGLSSACASGSAPVRSRRRHPASRRVQRRRRAASIAACLLGAGSVRTTRIPAGPCRNRRLEHQALQMDLPRPPSTRPAARTPGSCPTVSFSPVSHSETRGDVGAHLPLIGRELADIANDAIEEILAPDPHSSRGPPRRARRATHPDRFDESPGISSGSATCRWY